MKLTLILFGLVVGVKSGLALADDSSNLSEMNTEASKQTEAFDLAEPLFDFPMTRAIGLTVDEVLRKPLTTRPEIHTLAIPIVR